MAYRRRLRLFIDATENGWIVDGAIFDVRDEHCEYAEPERIPVKREPKCLQVHMHANTVCDLVRTALMVGNFGNQPTTEMTATEVAKLKKEQA